jgi:hypothetical protein
MLRLAEGGRTPTPYSAAKPRLAVNALKRPRRDSSRSCKRSSYRQANTGKQTRTGGEC